MFKNLSNEVWRDIEDYPGYQVSNLGRVRSLNFNHTGQVRILKSRKNKFGYLKLYFYKNGKPKTASVHRLVAIAFIPNPDNLPQVNHKDENKENNFVWVNEDGTVDLEKSNLEWCSASHNINWGSRNKKTSQKLSKPVAQYTLDGKLVATYSSTTTAAKKNGFIKANIFSCLYGRQKTSHGFIWKHID